MVRLGLASVCGRETMTVLSNTSWAVKAVSLLILCVYCLSFSPAAVRTLSVTPEFFWPPHFWVWTAFTHCFLEVHFWLVLIDIAVIVLVGKLLEPLWGALEMIIFFMVVNVGVAVVAAVFYYLLYMLTYDTQLLFDVHIHGLGGYLAGVSVAVKQVMPDHVLYRSPIGKITNRNIPLLIFAMSFLLWALGAVEGSFCTMFGSGLVVSWCYLRFYQHHSNGAKGDMADSFAFHTFFPNVLQPPIALVCNTVFAVLVRMRICQRVVRKYDIGCASSSISISLPGVESHDTERRRQIALKALSERLNKEDGVGAKSAAENVGSSSSSAWPNLEEEKVLESVHASAAAAPPPVESASSPAIATLVDIEAPSEEKEQQDRDVSQFCDSE